MKDDLAKISKNITPERFSGKSVLLIGSNGFLGRWFYDYFNTNNIEIFCIDNDISPSDSTANYIKHDICTELDINKRFDYVINCAGIASPEKYLKYPVETLDVSYIGTRHVLEYAKKFNVESVLMFSSSEVYGTPKKEAIPTKETYIGTIPTMGDRSCYDIGKQVLETLSNIYFKKYNSPVKIVRPFNFYGPHMGVKDNRVLSNFMNNIIDDIPINIYGDGTQTRTFCYAADGISLALGALLDGKNGEVYNIGNPAPEINMFELADELFNALNMKKNYIQTNYPSDYPSDEPLRRCPNIDKIVKLTGIRPSTGLNEGINKMYDYFMEIKK